MSWLHQCLHLKDSEPWTHEWSDTRPRIEHRAQIYTSLWFPSAFYYDAFPVCWQLSKHFVYWRTNKRKHREPGESERVQAIGVYTQRYLFPSSLLGLANVWVQNTAKCCSHQSGISEDGPAFLHTPLTVLFPRKFIPSMPKPRSTTLIWLLKVYKGSLTGPSAFGKEKPCYTLI